MDILIERDGNRFLLTGKTDRGRDFLDETATASSEWWGKSLIVARWQMESVSGAGFAKGLEFRYA